MFFHQARQVVLRPLLRHNSRLLSNSVKINRSFSVCHFSSASSSSTSDDSSDSSLFSKSSSTKEASTKMAFQAETRQLLDIVTNSIYTDKEVFLREVSLTQSALALTKMSILALKCAKRNGFRHNIMVTSTTELTYSTIFARSLLSWFPMRLTLWRSFGWSSRPRLPLGMLPWRLPLPLTRRRTRLRSPTLGLGLRRLT